MSTPSPMPTVWIILAPIATLGVFTLLLLMMGTKGERPPDDKWSGVFYSNPDDPALLVPKRYGIGYTLNFGNPWSWMVIVLLILTTAIPFILIAVNLHHLPVNHLRR